LGPALEFTQSAAILALFLGEPGCSWPGPFSARERASSRGMGRSPGPPRGGRGTEAAKAFPRAQLAGNSGKGPRVQKKNCPKSGTETQGRGAIKAAGAGPSANPAPFQALFRCCGGETRFKPPGQNLSLRKLFGFFPLHLRVAHLASKKSRAGPALFLGQVWFGSIPPRPIILPVPSGPHFAGTGPGGPKKRAGAGFGRKKKQGTPLRVWFFLGPVGMVLCLPLGLLLWGQKAPGGLAQGLAMEPTAGGVWCGFEQRLRRFGPARQFSSFRGGAPPGGKGFFSRKRFLGRGNSRGQRCPQTARVLAMALFFPGPGRFSGAGAYCSKGRQICEKQGPPPKSLACGKIWGVGAPVAGLDFPSVSLSGPLGPARGPPRWSSNGLGREGSRTGKSGDCPGGAWLCFRFLGPGPGGRSVGTVQEKPGGLGKCRREQPYFGFSFQARGAGTLL